MKVNKCLLRVAYPEFHRSYDSLLSLQNHFHTYVLKTSDKKAMDGLEATSDQPSKYVSRYLQEEFP